MLGLASGIVGSTAGDAVAQPSRKDTAGPTFDRNGPDAERYGLAEGYPVPEAGYARRQGNPWQPKYRVGAFSHLDAIYPTRRIERAAAPWAFRRSSVDIRYRFRDQPSSLSDYLLRNPVTGLLIARDDEVLFEHYQYGRTDRDRLVSQSMVKSVVGVLIGIAIADGAIRSVDDLPEIYVPGLKGSEYGRTPIRALLHMSSGVEFDEEAHDGRDLNRLWRDMVVGAPVFGAGTIGSITQFNHRVAAPGTRYRYASIEPDVLGIVLRYATGQSLSDYLRDKVWHPIGAEADATWLLDAEGFELAHFGLSAVLRDYARLGRLLAHDGAWNGRQIVPAQWMIEATTVRAAESYLAPGNAMRNFGYGYLLWLLPGARRAFALVGANGQRICVDPGSKLVMVHTCLEDASEAWLLWSALVEQFG